MAATLRYCGGERPERLQPNTEEEKREIPDQCRFPIKLDLILTASAMVSARSIGFQPVLAGLVSFSPACMALEDSIRNHPFTLWVVEACLFHMQDCHLCLLLSCQLSQFFRKSLFLNFVCRS